MTGYSRSCGVSMAACGASECRCVPVDPGPLFGPENGVQRFDLTADCAICDTTPPDCDASIVGGCCTACRATGGCTHQPRNPINTAHNQSREGSLTMNENQKREIAKALEALRWADQHFTKLSESNAALHTSEKVFVTPLASTVHAAAKSLALLLEEDHR